ncbi:unnamed protein product [Durusdinium trenchii]|uniref:EF-hand domain-containing protein n=1 Tax=Durusdinium trenchii TaxID=1381693 RepID=A0ABP0HNY8_9DINO
MAHRRCQVFSPVVSYGISLLILLHVILLGVEVDISASVGLEDVPTWFSTFNTVSVACFVVEMALKLLALGCRNFWLGEDSSWNILDFIVVAISVFDVAIDILFQTLWPSLSTSQLRLLRFARFARALRSIRVAKLFRHVRALRTLALSIMSTMSSLCWTLALLVILFYTFGVMLTQLVVEHCRFLGQDRTGTGDPMAHCPESLKKYWASVPESMLTLFMAMSQGINWVEAMEPLREVHWGAVVLILVYIVITIFTILNVVTGVFCNTAIESASADKDVATLKQVQAKQKQVEALQQIFQEIDRDQENEVSFEDVKTAIASGELADFLESIGISTNDVWTLFMLLDSDRKGSIDLDEFVSGCMQLHGPAKSLQMAKMSYENKLTRQAIKSLSQDIYNLNKKLTTSTSFKEPMLPAIKEQF